MFDISRLFRKQVTETMILNNEFIPISEAGFIPGSDTLLIKIIGAGWGSSGYYSKEVLKNSARLYSTGTRMFMNHPTKTEQRERPERSVEDLAGYLNKESAWWDENGPLGPGLYQQCRVFPRFLNIIQDAAKIIGISHYVLGRTRTGQADGRTGPIVDSIDEVVSVDFVTRAGAGGGIITEAERPGRIMNHPGVDDATWQLYESYRQNMSDSAARAVIYSLTGIQIPDENQSGISGSLTEADEMLIQSYVESGMRRETAVKIVTGL